MNSKQISGKLLLFSFILILGSSCNNDKFEFEKKDISIRVDTMKFDTLLSNKFSTIRKLVVYNNSNKNIVIPKIYANSDNCEIIISVSGLNSENNVFKDIEIYAYDSLFIFVKLKLLENPTTEISETVIPLIFDTPTNQIVYLSAFGINNEKLVGDLYNDSTKHILNVKNYFIEDSLFVGAEDTVIINAGTRFYMSNKSKIIVKGCLIIRGTKEEPVVFSTDRIEGWKQYRNFYLDQNNLWDGIIIKNSNKNCTINYAVINNAHYGLYLYKSKNLFIENSNIYYSSTPIYIDSSSVQSNNNILADFTQEAVVINGGASNFVHNTIVRNNNSYSETLLQINNEKKLVTFYNSIIIGHCNQSVNTNFMSYFIYNCILQDGVTKIRKNSETVKFDDSKQLFRDIVKLDFRLQKESQARNMGADKTGNIINNRDIVGTVRDLSDGKPDVGAYEYKEDTSKSFRVFL